MNDLESATTDELLDELAKRYPHVLFVGLREAPNEPESDDVLFVYRGGMTTAVGLAHRAAAHLTREANSELSEPDDEDIAGD